MNKQNYINAIFAILTALAVGLGCSGGVGKQVTEANKIIDETNKKIEEAKSFFTGIEARNKRLFSAKISNLSELERYKREQFVEARSIIGDYEICAELLKHISGQYDAVSRMDLDEKYRDYAKLKADEYAKRSEAVGVRKGNAQALLEIEDPDTLLTKLDDNSLKFQRLVKEAEDLGDKSKKLEEENKDIFKQS